MSTSSPHSSTNHSPSQVSRHDTDTRRLFQLVQCCRVELSLLAEELQQARTELEGLHQQCSRYEQCARELPVSGAQPEASGTESCSSSESAPLVCCRSAAIAELEKRIADLTPREKEVLAQISNSQCTKTIAKNLKLSPRTVEAHRAKILRKLHFTSLQDLLAAPLQCSLLAPQRDN